MRALDFMVKLEERSFRSRLGRDGAGRQDGVAPRRRAAYRSLRNDVTLALDGKSGAPRWSQGQAKVIGSGERADSNQSLGSASCENSGQA
jgi:hypothetical protein